MALGDQQISSVVATGDEQDAQLAAEVNAATPPFMELGATGLRRTSGYLDEEFLPQLRGRKAVQVYREMSENDPLIGSLLFTIRHLIEQADWQVTPGTKNREGTKAAEFVESCMHDMSHTWAELIGEILSSLTYGWSWHEVVYKRREGLWSGDSKTRSQHNDGMIGWRKMPIRSQETLQRWVFDESGDTKAMVQLSPPYYRHVVIPIERSLLFRYRPHKNSPEGTSMLRTAYRPWYYLKRLQEFESIGVERDLAGMPIVKVPADYLSAKPGTQRYKVVEQMRKMVKSLRRNEQEGLVFPVEYDQDTKQPLFNIELLGGGGGRAFSTDAIIQRYEQRILMTVLADFIMVGHQSVGTYNLHVDKTGIFRQAMNSVLSRIAEVFNLYAVPRLFMVNGWHPEKLPKLEPMDVDNPNITELSSFMHSMATLGVNWFPDGDLEQFVRRAAKLPDLPEDEVKRREAEQKQAEATRAAESMSSYLQARMGMSQAAVGAANPQGGAGAPQAGAGAPQQQPGLGGA